MASSAHAPGPASTNRAGALLRSLAARASYRAAASLDPRDYEAALCRWYERKTGEPLDLANPRTFDEKLQWLKLNASTPLKGRLSDKYLVRDWVAQKAGEQYLVPLLGVWDDPADINVASLPSRFVLKATHGCGWNILVPDASALNWPAARRRLQRWLKLNYAFVNGFELHYLHCQPRVIAEAYLENTAGDLHDYKFFCFGGKVAMIAHITGRADEQAGGSSEGCYDRDWNRLPCTYCTHPRAPHNVARPAQLNEAIALAETLSAGFAHVRVDLYLPSDGSVRFGEMTFTTMSGVSLWDPPAYNDYFGDLIDLSLEGSLEGPAAPPRA